MADEPSSEKIGPSDDGEESGVARSDRDGLKLSELAVLRAAANRIPFTKEERIKAARATVDAIESGSFRKRMQGLKLMVAFERVNLAETGLLLQAQKIDEKPVAAPVTINIMALPEEQLKALYDARQRLRHSDPGIRDGSGDGTVGAAG